jgi:hypothetical protein
VKRGRMGPCQECGSQAKWDSRARLCRCTACWRKHYDDYRVAHPEEFFSDEETERRLVAAFDAMFAKDRPPARAPSGEGARE